MLGDSFIEDSLPTASWRPRDCVQLERSVINLGRPGTVPNKSCAFAGTV